MGGGAGRVAEELARVFSRRQKVLLLLPGPKTKIIKKKGLNLVKLQIKSLGEGDVVIPALNMANINFIFKSLTKFAPNIIHAQDAGPLALVAQIWAIKHRVPFVYTAHILPTKSLKFAPEDISGQFGKFLYTRTIKKYLLDFFNTCDALIALNEQAKKDILKFGFKGKILIIPNGRDLKSYTRCSLAKIADERKVLTFVGGLSKRKNQQYLLRVMEYLPTNFSLNLLGKGEELEKLQNYVKKKKLKNINFPGGVNYQEIPKYLAQSHFFVSASKMEVQSLAVIEALASGTPVIGLANETIDELVDKTVGLRLEKDTSPREFAQKVKQLCSLAKEDYERLCWNARKRVSHLDWQEVVKQLEKAYRELIIEKKEKSRTEAVNKISSLEKILRAFKESETPEPIWKKNDFLSLSLLVVITFVSGYLYEFVGSLKKLRKLILEPSEMGKG